MALEMFSSTKASKQNRFSRLSLERLETRDCPATLTLNATVMPDSGLLLTGQISDGPNSGIYVQFYGSIHGGTVTNSDGTFSFVTSASSLAPIQAVGMDEGLDVTNIAEVQLSSNPPQITDFSAVNTYTTVWTITGRVLDENPEGLVVRFGGTKTLGYQTAIVQADGTFSLTCSLNPGESQSAFVSAITTDQWGLDSDVVYCSLM